MGFSVTILGCSSARPTRERHPSAQVVNYEEQLYLVDAGEGTQRRLLQTGTNAQRLRAVFISHLHGDHVFGLFPLLSTLGLYGRCTPLDVYAPAPFGEILDCYRRYFDRELPYRAVWHEVATTEHRLLLENRTMEVWSVPLRHRVPCAGYLFREKLPPLNIRKEKIGEYGLSIAQIAAAKRGEDVLLEDGRTIPVGELTYRPYRPRAYAYLSDTNFSAKAAGLAAGVDLLYHEATYTSDERKLAQDRGHATAAEAARAAVLAGARKLLIGHFSSRYKDAAPLVAQAREIFAESYEAVEGQVYTIEKRPYDN